LRREAETDCGAGRAAVGTVCASESAGLAPWHPATTAAITAEKKMYLGGITGFWFDECG
jgi:hypothetical protein